MRSTARKGTPERDRATEERSSQGFCVLRRRSESSGRGLSAGVRKRAAEWDATMMLKRRGGY